MSPGRGLVVTLAALLGLAPRLSAQTLRGRVLEEDGDRPVSTAIVRLLDADGKPMKLVTSDSAGAYRLRTPGPGRFYLSAERIGYETTRSPLLEVSDADGTYGVDISMARAPLGLEGFEVTARRFEEIERGIHLAVGLSVPAMKYKPIMRPTIEEHLAKAHNLTDLIRWQALPSVIVERAKDGPCFQWRARHCLEVYLNGLHITRDFVDTLPLDMIETIVVVAPGETPAYAGGAVLLYTKAWIS